MKPFRRLHLLIATICTLAANALSTTDITNVHLADRSRFVSDMAGAMSPAAMAKADSILNNIWQTTSAEPVVVVVPTLDGEEINDFATRLFTEWGIGKADRDNGVLMLISTGDRQATIRTGYGAEGVLPDIACAKIIRHDLAPHFRRGDYDGGIISALSTMQQTMTSEDARRELMSDQANDARADNASATDFFRIYLTLCIFIGCAGLILVLAIYFSNRKQPTSGAFRALDRFRLGFLTGSFLTIGALAPAYILMVLLMRHIRLHKRLCPHCHTRMERVDEDADNAYLTQPQDAEERLNSVDYDVWLCPECGETDIIPYLNPRSNLIECTACHARACTLARKRTIIAPTTRSEGKGIEEYVCLNCRKVMQKPYTIPREVATPIIIGGGGGNGFGGGGFGGGSFGGGMTGGGGASGGW